ncbi:MAG: NFACT RNA binding domain-containing protein [candidate division WOR-3 bacterium]
MISWVSGSKPTEMIFSEIDAIVVASEITRAMKGLFVSDVLGQEDELLVSFKGKGIYIKARPPDARLHGTWVGTCLPRHSWRRFLRGARFLRAEARQGERIIDLIFERKDPLGRIEGLTLVAELTGRYGNIILVNADGVVIEAMRRIRPGESRARVIVPGKPYVPPPPKQRNPFSLTGQELIDYLERYAPHLAEELKMRGHQPEKALWSYISESTSSPSPRLYMREGEALFPAPIEHMSQADAVEFSHYSEAMDAFFRLRREPGSEIQTDEEDKRKASLEKRLAEETGRAERFYKMGQAIIANMHRIPPGSKEIVIEGMAIPLDPKLSPGQNAEKYFEKYKRAKRGVAKLKKMLAEGVQKPSFSEESEPEPSGPPWLEFKSPSGFVVLVGKSAKSNYKITFEIAKPNDLFFHVKDSPGAHVILRTGGRDVPEEDILFAARLALEHSKAGGAKGLVSYTERRYVARPKGAKLGLVIMLREKVIGVRL